MAATIREALLDIRALGEGIPGESGVPLTEAAPDPGQPPRQGVFAGLAHELVIRLPADAPLSRTFARPANTIHVGVPDAAEIGAVSPGTEQAGELRIGPLRLPDYFFGDSFGSVSLAIRIESETGVAVTLHSGRLAVFLPQGPDADSLRRMAAFVSERCALLRDPSDGEGEDSLDDTLRRADSVIRTYTRNLRFMASSPRSRPRKTSRVDIFERSRNFTPASLSFIATHPDELIPSAHGIEVDGNRYLPKHTLTETIVQSKDIYENQQIVGFLKTVRNQTRKLSKRLAGLRGAPGLPEPPGYVFSGACGNVEVEERMRNWKAGLSEGAKRLTELYSAYRKVLPVTRPVVLSLPEPSAIFASSLVYRQFYAAMQEWFGAPKKTLQREKFLLSIARSPKLYELFALCALISALGVPVSRRRHKYSAPPKDYRQAEFCNTFEFRDGERETTLYYEPVIHSGRHPAENGLGLIRTTSRSGGDQQSEGSAWTPDYVLKVTEAGKTSWLVMDAKYSTVENIWTVAADRLVFKYLFSLQPANRQDRFLGLRILCGKASKKRARDLRDRDCVTGREPFFQLVELTGPEDAKRALPG